MNRRTFGKTAAILAAGDPWLSSFAQASRPKPTFLIVRGWQRVNIGDIAHTPGPLALLDRHFPNTLDGRAAAKIF